MKNILLLPLIFSFTLFSFKVYTPSRNLTSEKKQVVINLMEKYCNSGYELVKEYYLSPQQHNFNGKIFNEDKVADFMEFVKGNTEIEIASSLNTVIHEMCHAYTRRLRYEFVEKENIGNWNEDDTFYAYFLDAKTKVLVKQTDVFFTSEIRDIIPEHLHTLRYKTYIESNPDLECEFNGVYGLLNEFNAYYQGTKASVDLYHFYLQKEDITANDWLLFMESINASYVSYLEFKYYILKYLQFAKVVDEQVYLDIIHNENFKKVFNHIDVNFSKLISDYFELKQNLLTTLNLKMAKTTEDVNYTYIGSSGISHNLGDYQLLSKELAKSEYLRIIAELRK